jgi:acyl-coenzyme A thioesterase PaaI-like protein
VIGGGLAASAARPDWIATADLTLHMVAGAPPGSTVEARASVLRAGRTTVVLEVGLARDDGRTVGIATMSFSVLPRRDANPDVDSLRGTGPTTMATATSRLAAPLDAVLGLQVRDARAGIVEVPVSDWARNSMGAMQGGVVAMVADYAAEAALRSAAAAPVVVTDLEVTYLGFGRAGPVVSRTEVLAASPDAASARVELSDAGADYRTMTVVHAAAIRERTP